MCDYREKYKNLYMRILNKLNLDENVRAENLTLEQFGKIADYIS